MSLLNAPQQFQAGAARIQVYPSRAALGTAAAERAAALIQRAIEERGRARVIAATGNSQLPLVEALVAQPLDWKSVELFHMDEYAGMSAQHPASFRLWIRTRLEEKVHPLKTHYLAGDADDLEAEIARYSKLLNEAPIDLGYSLVLEKTGTSLSTIRRWPISAIRPR